MKIVKRKDEIEDVIVEFLPYMPRLLYRIDSLYSYIDKLALRAVVVTENDDVVRRGLIVFYSNDKESYIGFIPLIVIKDEYKKCGIGRRLIEFACREMKNRGMKTVRLVVNKDNHNAIGFYKHMGFSLVESKNVSTGYLMTKSLYD